VAQSALLGPLFSRMVCVFAAVLLAIGSAYFSSRASRVPWVAGQLLVAGSGTLAALLLAHPLVGFELRGATLEQAATASRFTNRFTFREGDVADQMSGSAEKRGRGQVGLGTCTAAPLVAAGSQGPVQVWVYYDSDYGGGAQWKQPLRAGVRKVTDLLDDYDAKAIAEACRRHQRQSVEHPLVVRWTADADEVIAGERRKQVYLRLVCEGLWLVASAVVVLLR